MARLVVVSDLSALDLSKDKLPITDKGKTLGTTTKIRQTARNTFYRSDTLIAAKLLIIDTFIKVR
ncbi:hypothetical protein [Psychrobacter sp. LV10R520-6]|uniref:hypothetical protein n=1 Tax=Psychrobacter sp. LV10R520-6 TaxID=1415574 RepID=UPI002AA0B5F9|nr:hypothetical protein [Psychrobacter sp. LV10R520-6]